MCIRLSRSLFVVVLAVLLLSGFTVPEDSAAAPTVFWPDDAFGPEQVAVIYNRNDPVSEQTARYYTVRRAIPASQRIAVAFDAGKTVLTVDEFAAIKAEVDRQLPAGIEVLVLVWARPYRVACMSVTSAFALGFDEQYCADGCQLTKVNPYALVRHLDLPSRVGSRLAMLLPATHFEQARELIDRGVAAAKTSDPGQVFLLSTSDKSRNVRARRFQRVYDTLHELLPVNVVAADALTNEKDILFYITGTRQVDGIESNRFRAGALADHLTSSGGRLTDSGNQMSSLRWLEGGATASYGTVVEPCNFLEKFPDPLRLMSFYLGGASAVEAYWKSVLMPGQGVFIGEPLARPFTHSEVSYENGRLKIQSQRLLPGQYSLESVDANNPKKVLKRRLTIDRLWQPVFVDIPYRAAYRLRRLQP